MKKNIVSFIVFLVLAVSAVWADDSDDKLLLEAVREQDAEKLERAIRYGANLNTKDKSADKTVLMIACEENWYEGVKMLLEGEDSPKKVNPSYRNNFGQTALMFAAQKGKSQAIVTLLMQYNVNLNDSDNMGKTVLMYAVDNDSDNILKFLIDAVGAALDLQATDNKGNTAMMYAAKKGNVYAFKILADQPGVNWNYTNIDGKNVLELAAESNRLDILQNIISRRNTIDPTCKNDAGQPVLFWLIERNKSENVVEWMMRACGYDALMDMTDANGRDINWYIKKYKNRRAQKILDGLKD